MSTSGRQHPAGYLVRIDGVLGEHWTASFGDVTLTHESPGTTSIGGVFADQADLHGLLAKLRDLGLTLLAVEPFDERSTQTGAASRDHHSRMRHPRTSSTADQFGTP